MATQLEYYTYSNGDTVAAVLNAVATFFNSASFASLLSMSAMISVVLTTGYFLITRNPGHIFKFAAVFLLVPLMLINSKATMQVIDLTEGNVNSVGNVPYLVAIPTYFATSTMYGFTASIESIFNADLTATEEYGKTGMTFGSALFQLSSKKSNFNDVAAKRRWDDFFLNCIKRDITINAKYTWQQVLDAPDIWAFINSQTMSPLRGTYVKKGEYKTCAKAAPIIEKEFDNVLNAVLIRQAQLVYGDKYQAKKGVFDASMQDAYQRYANISKSASDIIKQNMTMNAVRNSINDLGGTSGALNYAYTQNKSQTTSMWASIALQAKEFIPMMHTILFLLFACSSILIAVVAMIPSLTASVLTNYVKTFAVLAIWPALFAFLNFIMTTTLAQTTGGVTNIFNGVTLSNSNALDEMHTRFAMIAGYLMMSIPFLAGAIMKGGAAVMSNLSYQLSGMINSTNARTSAAASSGDLDFGNMRIDNQSYNTLNANKRDDTLLNREGTGMSATLGKDGVTTTQYGDGSKVYDAQSTYSNLGYTIASQDQVTQSINTAYTEQQAISDQHQRQLTETTSAGVSMGDRLTKSSLDSRTNNTAYGATDSVNANKGVDMMDSAVDSVMKTTGWSKEEADAWTYGAAARLGFESKFFGASGKAGYDHSDRTSTLNSDQQQKVETALLQFRDGANMVSDASIRTDASSSNSQQTQDAKDFGTTWNMAKTQAQTANQSYAKTESLATALNDSRSGSLSISDNLVDDFQRFVEKDINESSPSYMSEEDREQKIKNILTAQTGPERNLRDDYLAKFQSSNEFKLAVLDEALPTSADMQDKYNIMPTAQLTQKQQDEHAEAVSNYVSYFSDRVSNGESLFNDQQYTNQQDTVSTQINNTETDINERKNELEQPPVNTTSPAITNEAEPAVSPPSKETETPASPQSFYWPKQ